MLHTILFFPKGEESFIVEDIREKYDPLSSLIPAHITLVFPTEYSCPIEEIFSKLEEISFAALIIYPKEIVLAMRRIKTIYF